ncbi:chitin synthase [Geosmithia morbida]|uniref:chitin synthase n=1 Tax=Geosmithia morbida TaxID=1094350 RepID=A0A9P4YU43_9HYPO|nr:chitin synthase [Geosmithia morbida]KAF4122592.1 chitin synthase [Geosmithia morbida]
MPPPSSSERRGHKTSSTRKQRSPYRESPSSRRSRRPSDPEAGASFFTSYSHSPSRRPSHHERGKSASSYAETITASPAVNSESAPLSGTTRRGSHSRHGSTDKTPANGTLGRNRSLSRPDRRELDKDRRDYRYHKPSANMSVLTSPTGDDPVDHITDGSTDHSRSNSHANGYEDGSPPRRSRRRSRDADDLEKNRAGLSEPKPSRSAKVTKNRRRRSSGARKEAKDKQKEVLRPPSFWNVYCAIITFWCPDFILRCFGKPTKAQRRAWREKMGLLSIILLIMTAIGFITFGFTQVVCGTPPTRLRINEVSPGYMIFHGVGYDLVKSHHPPAEGMPLRSDGYGPNVLYDLPTHYGGMDGSFLFQNVNGACKGLITLADGSDVPTNDDDDLAWYFPCKAFNQDGSSEVNLTTEYYLGYACHTTLESRNAFYLDLSGRADVYFTWDDIANSTRNLMVYSSSVLDLDLLNWFNESQVAIPDRFKELRDRNTDLNAAVHGRDVTRIFQSAEDRKMARCFEEIIKVGSVDTETIGCIASKVVLYCALVVILGLVGARFVLAVLFQWFISPRYAAKKTSQSSDARKRNRQIEDWSEDIYRAPDRLPGDPGSTVVSSDRTKRSSILPTTSRFSNVYGVDPPARRGPTTMGNQAAQQLGSPMYRQGNDDSRASFLQTDPYATPSSGQPPAPLDGPGPAGFIHPAVVPQPPADWQPYGYPLAHTMILVTAYSEGEEGMRTTLDSLATTDYPNSHKVIVVICDGIIKGAGETQSTPDMCVGMLRDNTTPPDLVEPFSYVAVASGSKRHNMAKVHSGFYDYGRSSKIPVEKQQRVPMVVIVKCGTPNEATKAKPGNRGKRDTQIILMSFLQKVMFDERMTELEYEIFNGLWKVTGISPDFYEALLMVDADTKVFPDSLTHMVSAMVKDPQIMGLCGETKIANKRASWVTAIQVFEYFVSHHLAKAFESVFGGVTCLPGCFCMYRIKAPKGGQNYWVPIIANPDVVEHYSENVVETLHEKNLYLLGEDRFLSTLMLRTFPKRKQIFVPQAVCKTMAPDEFKVLLSQRRRWINSTIHNLMELVLVRDLCGTFCFRLILGLPGVLIVVTAHKLSYVIWMMIYLMALPIWNFVLPTYAFWKFDDFSWGETRKTDGEKKTKKAGLEYQGEFDSSKITMKRWAEFERERRSRYGYGYPEGASGSASRENLTGTGAQSWAPQVPPPANHPFYDSDY